MNQTLELEAILAPLGIRSKCPVIHTGIEDWHASDLEYHEVHAPADGQLLGAVQHADKEKYEMVISTAQKAFAVWRDMPAPRRGEIVRQIGDALRKYKEPLGKLVSLENG